MKTDPYYETAQICLNGHTAVSCYQANSERRSKYCGECGESTIITCPKCAVDIRGDFIYPNVISIGGSYDPPSFCHACGAAYPWTERRRDALIEAIDLLELSVDDRDKLKQAIPDVIQETPKTALAASRFKQVIGRLEQAGKWGGKVVSDVLTKVATEVFLQQSGLK